MQAFKCDRCGDMVPGEPAAYINVEASDNGVVGAKSPVTKLNLVGGRRIELCGPCLSALFDWWTNVTRPIPDGAKKG